MVNTPKKPTNQKGKSVYFNIDDPGELRLYQYAMNIKNFSGYMKARLYADMIQNNGQAPSPYDYAAIMNLEFNTKEVAATSTVKPHSVGVSEDEMVSTVTSNNRPEPVSTHESGTDSEDEDIENDTNGIENDTNDLEEAGKQQRQQPNVSLFFK